MSLKFPKRRNRKLRDTEQNKATDITGRKNVQWTIAESEAGWHSIVDNTSDFVLVIDRDGVIIFLNRALPGFSVNDFLGTSVMKYLPADIRKRIEEQFDRIWKTGVAENNVAPCPTPDGEVRVFESLMAPMRIVGETIGLVIYARDITNRSRTEETLRENEKRYRTLFEASNDAIFICEMSGKTPVFSDCNSRVLKMFGYDRDEIMGKTPADLSPPVQPDGEVTESQVSKTVLAAMDGEPQTFEWYHVRRDGTTFPCEVTLNRVEVGDQSMLQAVVRDITDRKRQQQELIKTQKLESLSVLAGGIAHDYNNILSGILGNVSLAIDCLEPESEAHEILIDAENATMRASNLTKRLLTFSTGGTPVTEKAIISDLIRESVEFALSGSNIRYQFTFAEDLGVVEIDKGQFSQVIQNLVLNAKQAMPGGGILEVAAENVLVEDTYPFLISRGKYVKITMKDTGDGIPKEHLDKVFDPFFTTRPTASGLGLSAAYSVIEKHGGTISVESTVGNGATFTIHLPQMAKHTPARQVDETETSTPLSDSSQAGANRILIMDDEEIIRKVADKALTRVGLVVDHACNAPEAVALFKQAHTSDRPYSLVILDLTIPGGMGGKEVIKALMEIDPGVKAIVCSGYATDPVMADFTHYGFIGAFIKPFRLDDLIQAVQRTLGTKLRHAGNSKV